jgi:hypothetical protein
MRSTLLNFFSRFRRKSQDPVRPRTMAESQNEDLQGQNPESSERKVFDERSFERGQEALHKGFGTSTHGSDNPLRENDH